METGTDLSQCLQSFISVVSLCNSIIAGWLNLLMIVYYFVVCKINNSRHSDFINNSNNNINLSI